MKDTGSEILTARALSPQEISGSSAVLGATIDRKGYLSGTFAVASGASSGSPSSFSMACKAQHGDASDATDMADVSGATGAITAVNSHVAINVDFRSLKRYVRVVVTPTFVAGSSPTLLMGATLAKGEACILPPA